jgi:hypothetical protein
MKRSTHPLPFAHSRFAAVLCGAFLVVLWLSSTAFADVVYVTSQIQGCTATSVCGGVNTDGTYTEVNITLGVTGIKGSGPGRPVTPTASRAYLGSALVTDTTAGVDIKPVLAVPGAVYQIDMNWNSSAGNSSTDVVMSISCSAGSVLSSNSTEMFRRSNGMSANWLFLGYITNGPQIANPTVSFRYQSGKVSASQSCRLLFDCFRFTLAQPCLAVPVPNVIGPLGANSSAVTVTGILTNTTQVKIYQDAGTGMTNIGSITTNNAPGTIAVPVSGTLVQGARISATQVVGGQESCVQASGTLVGGGANPPLRVALSIRYDPALTGPVGSAGSGGGNVYFLGASSLLSGACPEQGAILAPSPCWQTVSFTRGDENNPTDPSVIWNGTGPAVLSGRFGAFDGLAIACEGDPGPVDIYIDHLENGTNGVVQDWEGAANGQAAYGFSQPSFSGTTAGNILAGPNVSAVSTNNVYDGTKALRVQFQYADGLTNRWVRLVTANATPVQNPQLDLTQPISVRILVLPAGQGAHTFNGTISGITNNPPYAGTDATLGVTATGGPFTYQWSYAGSSLTDETNRTLTVTNVSAANNGIYRLTINDGTCNDLRELNLVALDPIPSVTNQPVHAIVSAGGTASFSVGADGHVAGGYPLFYQWQKNQTDLPGATDTTLQISNAQVSDVGGYDVVVANSYGSVTSAVAYLDVVPTGIAAGSGTGLRGFYYRQHFSTNAFSGAPALTRVDPVVDFNFGTGSPESGLTSDFFTIRWVGQVQALGDDNYTFSTISDDGVRLWVNNQLVVDNWTLHAPTTNSSAPIALTGVNKYDLQLEYFENTGGAVASLYWSNASGGVGFEPVPTSQLYPAAGTPAQPTVSFAVSGADITFSWGPGQYTLVWATDVNGPYTNKITGVTSPFTLNNAIDSNAQKFFKLQVE